MTARTGVPGSSHRRTVSLREHPVIVPAALLTLGVVFLIGTALAAMLLRQAWLSFEHESWKKASGLVTVSQLVPDREPGSTVQGRHMVFRYTYTVGGRAYEGVAFSMRTPPPPPRKIVREFPPGRRVTVHYDPGAPSNSVLRLDPIACKPLLLGFGVFGVVAAAAAAGGIGLLRRISVD